MRPLLIKEGVILVKPVAPDLTRGHLKLIKDDKAYRRGVVQDISPGQLATGMGILPGEVVYYTKPINKTEHGDYVEINNILCLQTV